MRTITSVKTVYNFSELSEEAKEHVIETLHDINTDSNYWHDSTIDQFHSILNILGFNYTKIYYSGFWSQGDGACFTCDSFNYQAGSIKELKKEYPQWVELHEFLDTFMAALKKYFYNIDIKLTHSGMYYHENSVSTDITINRDGAWISDEGHELFEDILRDFMRLIYKSLEEEHDYLSSKESIIETIECNEYEFTAEGDMA